MKKLIICLLFIVFFSENYSQKKYSEIYKSLITELNPEIPNPDQWIITETERIVNIFRQLNKYRLPRFVDFAKRDTSYNETLAKKYEMLIIKSKVFMIVVMGQYEIKSLSFKSSENLNYNIEELTDWNQLQLVLGKGAYDKLKGNRSGNYDISYTIDKSKVLSEYSINLNILNPSIQFFSYQSDRIFSAFSSDSLYENILSFAGQWGENLTVNPGWFSSDYILGLNLSSYNKLNLSRTYYRPSLSIMAGVSISKKYMLSSNLPPKPLHASGNGIYLKLTGKPWDLFSKGSSLKNLEVIISSKFNFSSFNWYNYGTYTVEDIFTNKNYVTFQINNKHDESNIIRFGEVKYGLGFSYYDIHHLQLDPEFQTVKDLEKNKKVIEKYRTSLFGEIGVENISNIFEYDFKIFINYESKDKYGYLGFLFNFLITDTFGFDVRFYRVYTGKGNLPPWRTDEYFVFSPIIRISN